MLKPQFVAVNMKEKMKLTSLIISPRTAAVEWFLVVELLSDQVQSLVA